MKKTKQLSKISVIMVLSYVVILIIPLLAVFSLYLQAENRIQSNNSERQLDNLIKIRDYVDWQLDTIETILLEIIKDERVTETCKIKGDLQSEDYYTFYQLNKLMANVQTYPQNCIDSIQIHYLNIDRIQTLRSPYDHDIFYRTIVGMNEQEVEEFESILNRQHYFTLLQSKVPTMKNGYDQRLCYMISLPVLSKQPAAVMVAIIDISMFREQLSFLDISENGYAVIMDENGNPIVSCGDQRYADSFAYQELEAVDSEGGNHKNADYFFTYVTSAKNEWMYTVVLPTTAISASIAEMRTFLFVAVVIVLGLDFTLIFFFSRKHTTPMLLIAEMLSSMGTQNPDQFQSAKSITHQVQMLIERNHTLSLRIENVEKEFRQKKELWENQNETLKETLLLRLVTNASTNQKHTVDMLRYLDVYFEHSFVMVAAVESPCLPKLTQRKDMLGLCMEITQDISGIYLVLMNFSDSSIPEVISVVQGLLNSLPNHCRSGASNIHEGVYAFPNAYNEAKLSLEYSCLHGLKTTSYEKISDKQDCFCYGIDTEWKLINSVSCGNAEQAIEKWREIVDLNMNQRLLSVRMIRSFMLEVVSTIMRICEMNQIEEDLDILTNTEMIHNFTEFDEQVVLIIKRICNVIESEKRSHNHKLKEDIMTSIHQNITNDQLSVAFLAEKHGITATYLSRFFKEQTGSKLQDYIAKERIEASLVMLKEKKFSLQDIAKAFGYSDATSYSRAFRRYMFISPGAYRKNNTDQ